MNDLESIRIAVAALAMQSLITAERAAPASVAHDAVDYADALLKRLGRPRADPMEPKFR